MRSGLLEYFRNILIDKIIYKNAQLGGYMLSAYMIFLCFSVFAVIINLFTGKTIWEKLLSFNLITVKAVLLISVYAVYKSNPMLLDVGLSYGIIGFLTVIIITRFVIKGARQK